MYGIVNQSIHGLILAEFGEDKWEQIIRLSGVEGCFFTSDEFYDDDISFELIAASVEVLELEKDHFLERFGEYWILETAQKKYGQLLWSTGSNFIDFMMKLPNFHNRILLVYPKLTPPEFTVEQRNESELEINYFSFRTGFAPFVLGTIKGLAKIYNTQIEIKQINTVNSEHNHETFIIKIV
jgi:hypothetical protein